jgi:hypothetical protein
LRLQDNCSIHYGFTNLLFSPAPAFSEGPGRLN